MDETNFHEIDLNKLEEEWVKQPRLYFQFASKLAEARSEWERAKTDRDIVYAEIYRDIKASPESYGIEKVTEEGVKNLIPLQKKHREITSLVLNTKHTVDVLQVAVDTLDHRKKALENAVTLWTANYFSTPKAPAEVRESLQKKERQATFGRRKKKGVGND